MADDFKRFGASGAYGGRGTDGAGTVSNPNARATTQGDDRETSQGDDREVT